VQKAGAGAVTDSDGDLRRALVARVEECWSRLEDVVSELHAVHEFGEEPILDRVRATIADELVQAS
jgi:hypothetical protein